MLLAEKIITYSKCKSVTYGIICTFLFYNQLCYTFLGFIFNNENFFLNPKKRIYDYAETVTRSSCKEDFKKWIFLEFVVYINVFML